MSPLLSWKTKPLHAVLAFSRWVAAAGVDISAAHLQFAYLHPSFFSSLKVITLMEEAEE
jgi:hypothetical protein